MNPLANYIWLTKLLQNSPRGLTFKEINEKYLEARRNTTDKNIPYLKRTFHNHINCISREYGIHIVCGPGYRYYIDDPFNDVASKIERLTIFDLMSDTASVNRSLFIEDNYQIFRNNIVTLIMDAIRAKLKIKLDYGILHIPNEKYRVLNVAPYQLHHINSNWFLIGHTDEFGLMRIPLFFYLDKVQVSDKPYKYPADYSPEKYDKMIYGIKSDKIHISIKIHYLHPERIHIERYPLMPFHQEIKGYDYNVRHGNSVSVDLELPNNPFALYILQARLGHYNYTILNDIDPFTLYTDQQYQNAVFYPEVL